MRLKTVRSGGWWPSAIASMIRGDKKPSRSNRRTERLSMCSRRAISSTELTCPEISSSAHRRARATALSRHCRGLAPLAVAHRMTAQLRLHPLPQLATYDRLLLSRVRLLLVADLPPGEGVGW